MDDPLTLSTQTDELTF